MKQDLCGEKEGKKRECVCVKQEEGRQEEQEEQRLRVKQRRRAGGTESRLGASRQGDHTGTTVITILPGENYKLTLVTSKQGRPHDPPALVLMIPPSFISPYFPLSLS